MAGRWMDLGALNARGRCSGVAIGRMVTGIASPVDSERGLAARLNYLTRPDAG